MPADIRDLYENKGHLARHVYEPPEDDGGDDGGDGV